MNGSRWRLVLAIGTVLLVAIACTGEILSQAPAQASQVTASGLGMGGCNPTYQGPLDAGVTMVFSDEFNCPLFTKDQQWVSYAPYNCVAQNNSYTDDAGFLHLVMAANDGGYTNCTSSADGGSVTNPNAQANSIAGIYTPQLGIAGGTVCARMKLPPFATNDWPFFGAYGIRCRGAQGTDTPGCTAGSTWGDGSVEFDIMEGFQLSNELVDQFVHAANTQSAGGFFQNNADPTLANFHVYCIQWVANGPGGGVNDAGAGLSFWLDGVNTWSSGTVTPGGGYPTQLVDSSVGLTVPSQYGDPAFLVFTNQAHSNSTPGEAIVDWVRWTKTAPGGP